MQSYAGNLKAHLTKPVFGKPIDSLEAILESGLEIGVFDDGEEEQIMMSTSTDPVISQIWEKRVELPMWPFDVRFVTIILYTRLPREY